MAVIAVTATDTGRETVHWSVPPDNVLNQTPIPRGLRDYRGAAAVLALGAGDETNVDITFTFPTAFIYLPKSISFMFQSDGILSEFGNLGILEYQPGAIPTLGLREQYSMASDGQAFRQATRSVQIYRPQGTWRQFVNGPNGDTIHINLADMSMDTSEAGDVTWSCDFWEYDIEQCLKWPVNTPIPQFSY